jgi:plastocyanin
VIRDEATASSRNTACTTTVLDDAEPDGPPPRIPIDDTDREGEMKRWIPMAALVAGAAALTAGCGGGSDDAAPATTGGATASGDTLNGSVGPGFDISMDKTEVAEGTYTLNVDDMGTQHNFHLTGSGVDVKTDVAGTGKESFTVTLQKGTYTFVCDPHSSSMKGTLTVN